MSMPSHFYLDNRCNTGVAGIPICLLGFYHPVRIRLGQAPDSFCFLEDSTLWNESRKFRSVFGCRCNSAIRLQKNHNDCCSLLNVQYLLHIGASPSQWDGEVTRWNFPGALTWNY